MNLVTTLKTSKLVTQTTVNKLIASASQGPVGAPGSNGLTFKNIAVDGQDTIIAETNNDTLTFIAGANTTIETDSVLKTITLNASGGGAIGSTITGGTAHRVLFIDASGNLAQSDNLSYNAVTGRLGVNTANPEGVLHVKEVTHTLPPNPTGSLAVYETDIGSGSWTNDGNAFGVYVYTYKVVEGVTLYCSTPLIMGYSDDSAADHTYNIFIEMSDALPAGADGYRAFLAWTDNSLTDQWVYDRYIEFTGLTDTVTISNPTLGTATSGTVVYKTIHENLERWYKNSTVRFMDSSNVTHAIWDATNKRFGVGTATPTQYTHFKSTVETLPDNPIGTVSVSEVTGYSDPYENTGTTHTYRVYSYKLVGGQIILSSSFITGTYTDDNMGGSYYSVEVSMSNPPPSGADGFCILKASYGYSTSAYWLTDSSIIDGFDELLNDYRVQFSSAVGRVLIEDSNIEAIHNTNRKWFYDAADGSFDTLKVRTRNTSQNGLRIDCINGQSAFPISVAASNGANLFYVSASGQGVFASSITAVGATLSAGLTGTTATFSSNVSVGGTLTVTSVISGVSTIATRSATFTTTNASAIGLTVNGVTSQSGNLADFRATSGGTILANVTAAGRIGTFVGLHQLSGASNVITISSALNNPTINVVGSAGTGVFGSAIVGLGSAGRIKWHSNTDGTGSGDVGLYRNAAGVLEVNNATANGAGNYRDLIARTITASGGAGFLSDIGFRVTAFGAYVGVLSGARCTFGNGSGVSTFGTGNTAHVVALDEAPSGQAADIRQFKVNGVVVSSITANGSLSLTNGANIIAGTTTGSKIGEAANQKIAFYGKTPIVQPTTAITAAAFVGNTSGTLNDSATFGGYTIGQMAAALISEGLLA